MIELTNYFNNKGLSNIANYKSANLSITGYSIPVENNKIFELPFLNSSLKEDNIECFGQEIEIKKTIVTNKVVFYGVGIQGDVSGEVQFLTKEGNEISSNLCFSAYDYETAFFEDNIPAYKSSYLYNCNSDNHFKFERVGVIWKFPIEFGDEIKLQSIILPFHPGMHIFAIDVEEGS